MDKYSCQNPYALPIPTFDNPFTFANNVLFSPTFCLSCLILPFLSYFAYYFLFCLYLSYCAYFCPILPIFGHKDSTSSWGLARILFLGYRYDTAPLFALKGLAYRCHIVSDITNLSSDFYKKSREAQSETQSDAMSLDWDFSNLTTRNRTGLKLHHPTSYRTKRLSTRALQGHTRASQWHARGSLELL